MALTPLLARRKAAVLRRWRELIRHTYAAHTARFLEGESDRFHNPVGHAILDNTEKLFDLLLTEGSAHEAAAVAEDIIKIRSIQDFSPSQAVSFVFLLKQAIRQEVAGELGGSAETTELLDLESRIDEVALSVFDLYMRCRERVYEIRVGEIKRTWVVPHQRPNAGDDTPHS